MRDNDDTDRVHPDLVAQREAAKAAVQGMVDRTPPGQEVTVFGEDPGDLADRVGDIPEASETLVALMGKAIPERMDGAERGLAAFRLEMHRELQALKNTGESGRRERERLAWIEFAKAELGNGGSGAGAATAAREMADKMLEQYRKRWEADNE